MARKIALIVAVTVASVLAVKLLVLAVVAVYPDIDQNKVIYVVLAIATILGILIRFRR
jgi:hypothetical protein